MRGGKLGAALLPAAPSCPLPTGHERFQCPPLASPCRMLPCLTAHQGPLATRKAARVSPHSIPIGMWADTFLISPCRPLVFTHLAPPV